MSQCFPPFSVTSSLYSVLYLQRPNTARVQICFSRREVGVTRNFERSQEGKGGGGSKRKGFDTDWP